MIERGVACVEPSVQRLLRQVERPIRSRRQLGHSFWSCWNSSTKDPTWWPLFLEATKASGVQGTDSHPALNDHSGPFLDFLYPRIVSQETTDSYASTNGKRPKRAKYLGLRSQSSHAYTTTPSYRQKGAPESRDLSAGLDNQDVASHDFWSHQSPLEGDEKTSIKAGKTRGINGRYGIRVDNMQKSRRNTLKNPPIRRPSPQQTYQEADDDNKSKTAHRAAMAAIDLHDIVLARDIIDKYLKFKVRYGQVMYGYQILGNGLQRLLEQKRFSEAGYLVEGFPLVQRLDFQTDDHFRNLPATTLYLVRQLKTAGNSNTPEGSNMRGLAKYLLDVIMHEHFLMGGITPNGFEALVRAYQDVALLKGEDLATAITTLNKMGRSRPRLAMFVYGLLREVFPFYFVDESIYGAMISMSLDSDVQSSELRCLLAEMGKMHGKADLLAYHAVLQGCSRRGDAAAVRMVFDELCTVHGPQADPAFLKFLTPLIHVHARVGNVEEAQKIFDWILHELHVVPDAKCWNTLLSAYMRAGDLAGGVNIFRDMKKAGFVPDHYSFGAIMAFCAGEGDTASVLSIAKEAEAAKVPLTMPMIDTLVRTYCANGEPSKAEAVVESAMQMNLEEESIRLWNTLLTYHAHRANTKELLRLQQNMKEHDVQPDSMSYAALMLSLTKTGRSQDALKILRALHINQLMTISVTHYATVMHGFAREGNRDMVTTLYIELMQRFNRPGLSASLAMLKMQINRDEQEVDDAFAELTKEPLTGRKDPDTVSKLTRYGRAKTLPHAEAFLDTILDQIDFQEIASRAPAPGIGRLQVTHAVPAVLFRLMMQVLGRRKAYQRITKLLSRYREVQQRFTISPAKDTHLSAGVNPSHDALPSQEVSSTLDVDASEKPSQESSASSDVDSSDYPSQEVSSSSDVDSSSKVTSSRDIITSNNLRLSEAGLPRELIVEGMRIAVRQNDHAEVDRLWELRRTQALKDGRSKTDIVERMNSSSQVSSDRTKSKIVTESAAEQGNKIMRSKRYELSHALNQYMYSLGARERHSELISTVKNLRKDGFEMTSKNWNLYVQLMANSPDPEHQFTAFTTFEEHLLDNMPSWNLLRKGLVLQTSLEEDESGEAARIATHETIDRDTRYPHYTTLVFLGAALMKLRKRGKLDDGKELHKLLDTASKTVIAVAKMPYLRDRPQGVLLREKSVQGDILKRLSKSRTAKPSHGLLGSESGIDSIPPQYLPDLIDLQRALTDEDDQSMPAQRREEVLQLADLLFGQQDREPAPEEGEDEVQKNAKRTKEDDLRLSKVKHLTKQVAEPQMIADEIAGDPSAIPLQSFYYCTAQYAESQSEPRRTFPKLSSRDLRSTDNILRFQRVGDYSMRFYDPVINERRPEQYQLPHTQAQKPFTMLSTRRFVKAHVRRKERAFSRNKRLALQRRSEKS